MQQPYECTRCGRRYRMTAPGTCMFCEIPVVPPGGQPHPIKDPIPLVQRPPRRDYGPPPPPLHIDGLLCPCCNRATDVLVVGPLESHRGEAGALSSVAVFFAVFCFGLGGLSAVGVIAAAGILASSFFIEVKCQTCRRPWVGPLLPHVQQDIAIKKSRGLVIGFSILLGALICLAMWYELVKDSV